MRAPILVFLGACGTAAVPTTGAPPAPAASGAAGRWTRGSPTAGRPMPCARSTVPELQSYWDVAMPATYWVDMVWSDGFWQPVKSIPMPYHHATGIALANVSEFPEVAAHARPVRFTLEITSRDIRKVEDQNEWHTQYHARILAVCAP